MPNVRPAEIYFKGPKAKKVLGPMEGFSVKDGMLTIYTVEPDSKQVQTKARWGQTKTEIQQYMREVPILGYPLDDIEKVDFGFMKLDDYKARLAYEKKQAEEQAKYTTKESNGKVGKEDSTSGGSDNS